MENKHYGFIPDEIKAEDYMLGASPVPGEVLAPDGQWDAHLPVYEAQKRNGLETSNCTVYGSLNCIETLLKRKYELDLNYSERYVGVMAGTTPSGNSPHAVLEVIRKDSGLIPDGMLPFREDMDEWDEYYSPNPMTIEYIVEGRKWLRTFLFKHEWVYHPGTDLATKQSLLKEALKYSPVGISVYAWAVDPKIVQEDVYIKPKGKVDNHWCTLYGYEDGKYWKVFDHYEDEHKKLAWDYDFTFAKRFYVDEAPPEASNWLTDLIKIIISLIKKLL